jgi:hypothetical protein
MQYFSIGAPFKGQGGGDEGVVMRKGELRDVSNRK